MKSKKDTKKQDILFILISSFVVVVAWIAFNIYHIWATSTISPTTQQQLTPIDPKFDPATLQDLKTRENINPLYTTQQSASTPASTTTQISPIVSSAPVTLVTPSASSSSRFAPTNAPINRLGQ